MLISKITKSLLISMYSEPLNQLKQFSTLYLFNTPLNHEIWLTFEMKIFMKKKIVRYVFVIFLETRYF